MSEARPRTRGVGLLTEAPPQAPKVIARRTMAPSVGKRSWPWVTPVATAERTKEEHRAAINAEARDRQTAVREAKAARLVEHAKVKRARG